MTLELTVGEIRTKFFQHVHQVCTRHRDRVRRLTPNSWVMLQEPQGFVRLPGEKPLYKSPPRTSFALTTPRTYPGNEPVSVSCDSGTLYLTNQRVSLAPSATARY